MIRKSLAGSVVAFALMARAMSGQAKPVDATDAARFDRVAKAAAGFGYDHVVVLAHGTGPADLFFVLTATTHGDSGVVIATTDPADPGVRPLVLERGRTLADIAAGSVDFKPFLGTRDMVDIVVLHQPLALGAVQTVATHHIVQPTGPGLTIKCDVDGDVQSSAPDRVGAILPGRSVTLESVPGQPMSFMVTVVEKTMREQAQGPATTSDSVVATRRYEMQPKGICRVLKPE